MTSTNATGITPAKLRTGAPDALAALCNSRGAAVFAYCQRAVGRGDAAEAAAEAFAQLRIAILSPGSLTSSKQAEQLLRSVTRRTAMLYLVDVDRPGSEACSGLTSEFLACLENTLTPADRSVLAAHVGRCHPCAEMLRRLQGAEEAFKVKPSARLPRAVAAEIVTAMVQAAPVGSPDGDPTGVRDEALRLIASEDGPGVAEPAQTEAQRPKPASTAAVPHEPAPTPAETPDPAPTLTEPPEPAPTPTEPPAPAPTPAETPDPAPTLTEPPEPAPTPTEPPAPAPTPAETPDPAPMLTEPPEPAPTPTELPEPAPSAAEPVEPDDDFQVARQTRSDEPAEPPRDPRSPVAPETPDRRQSVRQEPPPAAQPGMLDRLRSISPRERFGPSRAGWLLRSTGRFAMVVVAAGAAGTLLGIGIAALTGEDDTPSSAPGVPTSTNPPVAVERLRVDVTSTTVAPAAIDGVEGARVTVRARVENRSGRPVSTEPPRLLIDNIRVAAEPASAGSSAALLARSLAAGAVARGTLRFDLRSRTASELPQSRVRLRLAGRIVVLEPVLGEPPAAG